jgi:carotenoid cleavage dioxygenase-like enzyme
LGGCPAGFPDGKFSYVGPNPKFPREHYKKWGTGPDQPSLGFGEGWHHWFEGDGMVYAVDFTRKEKENDGDDSLSSPSRLVTYRNRYVRTNSWHDELEASTRLFAPLMNASGESFLPNAVHNLFRGGSFLKDSANTALANYGGKMLALQDTMPPWELDADSLETKGACDFDGQLPFYVPFTAHPKVAPDTGHLHFFGFNPVYPPHISLGALDGDTGKMSDVTSLWHNAAQGATFMHDFCVTAKRIVLFEGSMNIRPTRMLGGKHPLMYDPKQRARFGLADRDPSTGAVVGDVRWCECSCAQMVYHFINAYECEETGNVVVTGVREDGFFHGALAANGTRQWIEEALASGDAVPRVHEWVIDPVSCEVIGERWLFDDVVEVPRINDAFAGVKNRFAYAGRVHGSSLANDAQLKFDAVVKFDLETGRSETYEHGVGRYGMEQQFVPATNGKDEDDGWLVLYVHDEAACAVACDETRCETTASTSTSAETSQGEEKKGAKHTWPGARAALALRRRRHRPHGVRRARRQKRRRRPGVPHRASLARALRRARAVDTRCGRKENHRGGTGSGGGVEARVLRRARRATREGVASGASRVCRRRRRAGRAGGRRRHGRASRRFGFVRQRVAPVAGRGCEGRVRVRALVGREVHRVAKAGLEKRSAGARRVGGRLRVRRRRRGGGARRLSRRGETRGGGGIA